MALTEEIIAFYESRGLSVSPTGESQGGVPTYNVSGPLGSDVISLSDLEAQMTADSGTGLPSNIRVTQSPDGLTNQFWEVTPNGSFPLAQSQNPQLEALAKSLKAAGLEDATNVSPQDVSAYVGRFANEYGLSAPSQPAQPQGNFVQGKDLPTGVPPGMEDQWFMRDPRGGLSAWQPPEQSPLTLDQQIGQMVSQGKFEAARQLNEMKRAFNEKRMTQEEIADRASRLAQTPQEMQAWMSAMTGSTGPTPGDGTSWGSAYPPASMSQVIDQFKQIMATQPTPETTPVQEQPSIAADQQDVQVATETDGERKTSLPTGVEAGYIDPGLQPVELTSRQGKLGFFNPRTSEIQLLPPMPIDPDTGLKTGLLKKLDDLSYESNPVKRMRIQFGLDPETGLPLEDTTADYPDMISEEQQMLLDEEAASRQRMFDPRQVSLDDARRIAQERMREMGYSPERRPELFYGSEEEELLQEEPQMGVVQPRGIRDIRRSVARGQATPDRSRLMMEDPRDPTAYMSGGGATEAYRARLRREAQDQIAGDRSRFELLPSETSTGMLNPEVWSREMARRRAQEGIPREVVAEDRSRMEPTALRSSLGMLDPDAASLDYARRLAQQDMIAAGLRDEPVLDEEQQMLLDEPTARGLRGLGTFPSYQMAQQYGDMRPPETDRPFRGSRSSLGMIDPSITLEQARLMAQQDIPSDWHTTGRQDTRPFTGAVSPLGMLDPSKVGLEPAQIIARESAKAQFPSPLPSTAMTGTVATQPILDPIEDIGAMPRRAEDILAAPGAAALYERGLGRLAISPREMEFLDTSLVDIDERKTNKKPIGSFQYGGVVDEDGAYNLHQGEIVVNPSNQLNPYQPMSQSEWQQIRQEAAGAPATEFTVNKNVLSSKTGLGTRPVTMMGAKVSQEYGQEYDPIYGEMQYETEARKEARGQKREEQRQRRQQRELARQRKQDELSGKDMGGVSGGGRFFAGSQIIPYADTAARLKALQTTGLSRQQAAMFDQAERERSMARQQRFVRRGGKRRTYG